MTSWSKERWVWAQAHVLARQLRYDREELRTALSHLGLAFLHGGDTFVFDIRQKAGTCWFDRHYTNLMKAQ